MGNSLGSRPVIRQSKYFRQYESGNATKSLLGMSNLQWDTEKTEGCFSGGRVHDEYNRNRVLPKREAAAHDEYLQQMQSQSQGQTDAELLQLQQRQHYVQQQQHYALQHRQYIQQLEQQQPNPNNKNRDALDVFISSHSPPPQRPQRTQKPEPQNDSRWQTTSQSYGSF
ncbi:hypothetical protein TrVE_jg575 [Triparma verrucosa]|uniref:Uncharacterized protein n=1 Tax=Triparma verrucosa TaxID=1606542 RepID=A0A9W7F1F4_9STRA|nr:hypothetical protein TrVE_jg575 [Triparma verrucosa]